MTDKFVRFESTIWTQIRQAKAQDTTAVEDLVQRYQSPVCDFLRQNGLSLHDAEDVAQEVFTTIFKDKLLRQADESKGRFRSLILAITKKVLSNYFQKKEAAKRQDAATVSLDEVVSDQLAVKDLVSKDQIDENFDRIWMLSIVNIALDKLKKESHAKDTPYFSALKMYINDGLDQETIAKSLGKTTHDIKNYIHRSRLKLIKYIRDEIANYSSSKDEYEQELKYLSRFLGKL